MLVTFQAFCSQPVFVPHIRGGDLPPGTVTPKESVSQFPCLVAEPTADAPFAPTGPIVTVVAVTCGITATNKAAMQDPLYYRVIQNKCLKVQPELTNIRAALAHSEGAGGPFGQGRAGEVGAVL